MKKRPTAEHIQRILRRERELEPWLFTPPRDDQERAQLHHGMARLIAEQERQRTLPLPETVP